MTPTLAQSTAFATRIRARKRLCATTTAMTRTHGRAPPGQRVYDAVPSVNGQIKTLKAASNMLVVRDTTSGEPL